MSGDEPRGRDNAAFAGFPAGARATLLPNLLFSDVLPAIEDPAEMLVSLYAFFALGRKRAALRWLSEDELAAEPALARSLGRLPGGDGGAALQRGLAAAVARGTLIKRPAGGRDLYTVNTAVGRRSAATAADTAGDVLVEGGTEAAPNIYALYEEHVGTISPLIADELRAAEEEYPAAWIEAAFREAAALNRRSWRYIARILERWRAEGRTDAAVGRDPEPGRDLAGRYHGLVRR